MTDIEKLKKLFAEFGIGFKEGENRITCEEGDNKIEGYVSFYTIFEFDNEGKFIEMGAYE